MKKPTMTLRMAKRRIAELEAALTNQRAIHQREIAGLLTQIQQAKQAAGRRGLDEATELIKAWAQSNQAYSDVIRSVTGRSLTPHES